jgi:hypothetical protein
MVAGCAMGGVRSGRAVPARNPRTAVENRRRTRENPVRRSDNPYVTETAGSCLALTADERPVQAAASCRDFVQGVTAGVLQVSGVKPAGRAYQKPGIAMFL